MLAFAGAVDQQIFGGGQGIVKVIIDKAAELRLLAKRGAQRRDDGKTGAGIAAAFVCLIDDDKARDVNAFQMMDVEDDVTSAFS